MHDGCKGEDNNDDPTQKKTRTPKRTSKENWGKKLDTKGGEKKNTIRDSGVKKDRRPGERKSKRGMCQT